MALIDVLRNKENFTEREKDIAEYILAHPENIAGMSSRELGYETFTSAASITRFCRKIGTKGFPEFKIQFVSELKSGIMEENQEKISMSERENAVTMMRKIRRIQEQAVEQTQKELSFAQLVRVSRMIADAQMVDFYAYDTNVHLAQYGCALFFHAGKRSAVYSATNIQGLHAVMKPDKNIAIVLSHTGKNERLVEIEKLLKRNGTKIIAITPDSREVVARHADEVLVAAGLGKVEEFWTSMFFSSGKYILDLLYGMEFSRNYQENIQLNAKYEQAGEMEPALWGLKKE